MEQNYSFWEKALYEKHYDLIVVGGGLTGQSTAYFFKKEHPSADVLVIDRGFFPIGASTRNAGFACIGTIGEHITDLEIDSEEQLKERIKNRYEGLLLLRETLGDEAIEYSHTGGWEIFLGEQEFLKAKEKVGKFNSWMEELIGEKAIYKVGTYNGFSSIFNRCEGMLHPGKMIQKLYEMNRKLGVEFRLNTQVEQIYPASGEVITKGSIILNAEKLVVTTNAFTSILLPKIKIMPARGYVFITKPMDPMNWKGTFHYDKGYVYFRNIGEDRMLIGGGRNIDPKAEETYDFGINKDVKGFLLYFSEEVLGLPKDFAIEQEWSGIMGFTESKSPSLEKVSDKCLVAAGLSGMGVALGMKMGKTAANQL